MGIDAGAVKYHNCFPANLDDLNGLATWEAPSPMGMGSNPVGGL